jgi:N-acyl-phosphatidylethanolamine-hydrolysing phospholipase D
VVGPRHRFFYTGDTGFCEDEFRKIGTKLGPFDLSAIPIGCFKPNWFMRAQHIGPTEAVQIHKLVRSKKSIGIHWGTYSMRSFEAYMEPKETLAEEAKKAGLAPNEFVTLNHGETLVIDEKN